MQNLIFGVGITGELAKNSSNIVYYAIYLKQLNIFIVEKTTVIGNSRSEKKNFVAKKILEKILEQF